MTSKREVEPVGRARRGDANARREAADGLPHAFDPLQLADEGAEDLARKIVGKLLGQRRAELAFDSAHNRIEPQPQETLAHLLVGQAKASLAEPSTRDGERDHFTVDQHAVAIEDDDLGPAGLLRRLTNFPLGLLQDLVSPALSGVERRDRPACGGRANCDL